MNLRPRLPEARALAAIVALGATAFAAATFAAAFGASAAATGAAPPAASDAAATLARAEQALGAEARRSHGEALLLEGTADFLGSPATTTLLILPDGRFHQATEGRTVSSRTWDGTTMWARDLGGEVRQEVFGERTTTRLEMAVVSGSWTDLARSWTLESLPPQGDPPGPALAFAIAEDSIQGTIDFDPATHLPRRWSWTRGDSTNTMVLGEWRECGGMHLPGSVAASGSTGTVSQSRITKASLVAAPESFQVPAPPADWRYDASIPADVEVVRAPTGHLLVHPLVNGRDPGWFILDTGAGINCLSKGTVAALGLQTFGAVPAAGVGGTVSSPFCQPDSLSLGPLTLERPLTVVLDLDFLSGPMGRPIGGIVGYGLFARSTVRLDLSTPALRILDASRGAADLAPPVQEGEWVPLALAGSIPCVRAAIEGHEGFVKLDTGAGRDTITLHAPAVERLKLLEGRETTPTRVGGVGGSLPAQKGTLAWIQVGSIRHQDVPAVFATTPKGSFSNPDVLGNMGVGLFEECVLVFDYPRQRMAFVRRDAAAAPPAAQGAAAPPAAPPAVHGAGDQ